MASFGGACIVFAALALMRTPDEANNGPTDPLGELVSRSDPASTATPGLKQSEVTFPKVLSDQANATTAMEVVRSGKKSRRATVPVEDPNLDEELPRMDPPPATDRLPVMPLPAHDVLHSQRSTLAEGDTLRAVAERMSRETDQGEVAEAGHDGGYQLQVSSFKEKGDADTFALVLRRRGHRAYVATAHVKGRGVWHRVRVGPFRYKRSAEIYRQDFEAKERMVTFIIDPPKAHIRIGLAE